MAAKATTFGVVTDYFGLEDATKGALVAEWSDDGLVRNNIIEYNGNDGDKTDREPPPFYSTIRLRNPSVRYRVAAKVDLSIVIGSGFPATSDGARSGYMIVAAQVDTKIGEAPSVTVQSVANEGVDAARTYTFAASLTPRHRPQDALQAFSLGGSDLLDTSFGFSCDPVVIERINVKIASDIMHGRIWASATFADYEGTASPSARSPFALSASPASDPGEGYRTYKLSVFKEVF